MLTRPHIPQRRGRQHLPPKREPLVERGCGLAEQVDVNDVVDLG